MGCKYSNPNRGTYIDNATYSLLDSQVPYLASHTLGPVLAKPHFESLLAGQP